MPRSTFFWTIKFINVPQRAHQDWFFLVPEKLGLEVFYIILSELVLAFVISSFFGPSVFVYKTNLWIVLVSVGLKCEHWHNFWFKELWCCFWIKLCRAAILDEFLFLLVKNRECNVLAAHDGHFNALLQNNSFPLAVCNQSLRVIFNQLASINCFFYHFVFEILYLSSFYSITN